MERKKEKKQEKKTKQKKKRRENCRMPPELSQLNNGIFKCKCTTVKFQEESKVTYCIFSWIPIFVKRFTLLKNITSQFNQVKTT